MKYKIKKITEKRFGKTYSIWYNIMTFRRDWHGTFFGIIIPLIGWFYLFVFNPFKKKWRTIQSFSDYSQALYFIKNDESTYKTKEEFVSSGVKQ